MVSAPLEKSASACGGFRWVCGVYTILEYVFIDRGGKTGAAGIVSRTRIIRIAGIDLQLGLAMDPLPLKKHFLKHTMEGSTSMSLLVFAIVVRTNSNKVQLLDSRNPRGCE
jgi:hypothetical protein